MNRNLTDLPELALSRIFTSNYPNVIRQVNKEFKSLYDSYSTKLNVYRVDKSFPNDISVVLDW